MVCPGRPLIRGGVAAAAAATDVLTVVVPPCRPQLVSAASISAATGAAAATASASRVCTISDIYFLPNSRTQAANLLRVSTLSRGPPRGAPEGPFKEPHSRGLSVKTKGRKPQGSDGEVLPSRLTVADDFVLPEDLTVKQQGECSSHDRQESISS